MLRHTSAFWRQRAEEVRIIQEDFRHDETKKILQSVADSYEYLADQMAIQETMELQKVAFTAASTKA